MTTMQMTNDKVAKGMRWGARGVGLVAGGLFLLFLIESGASGLSALSWSSLRGMPMFLALLVAVIGALAGWRRENLGGMLALLGGMTMLLLSYLDAGAPLVLTTFFLVLPLLVVGMLYMGYCWRARVAEEAEGRMCQMVRNESRMAVA